MIKQYQIGTDWEKFDVYRKEKSRGLLTGFAEIDKTIIGLPSLVTVMGEPKCCKSTFVMDIALYRALKGTPVILLDKENGLQRTRLRSLCYLSDLTVGAIKSNRLTEDEDSSYAGAVSTLRGLPFYYLNETTSKAGIEDLIQEVVRKHKRHVLLVADSLQSLVQDFKDRRGSIDEWVFFFNDLKLRYERWLTTILVSEKNRGGYGQSSKGSAKESGGVEYKSEMVIDLYPAKESNRIIAECTWYRDGDTGILAQLEKPSPYTYKLQEMEYVPDEKAA